MQPFIPESLRTNRLVLPARIIVATDLTDQERLLPHIIAQGKTSGACVTLVHAIQPNQCISCDSCNCPNVGGERDIEDNEKLLAAMAGEIESHNVSCTWILKRGFAADIVRDQINTTGATRLIIGTHGRGKLGQFVLGSVANQLLGTVAVPIFLVGPHSEPVKNHCSPRRILHPVSMKGDYRRSADLAIQIGQLYQAEVTMLHIADDREVRRSLQAGLALSLADKLFAEFAPGNNRHDSPVKISVAFGEPVDQISKEATRIDADWIVLGVAEGSFTWPLRESTAYRTLVVSECPVLAVRHLPVKVSSNSDATSLVSIA
jgi:nucleotide-binding universal stress UspA family protein